MISASLHETIDAESGVKYLFHARCAESLNECGNPSGLYVFGLLKY